MWLRTDLLLGTSVMVKMTAHKVFLKENKLNQFQSRRKSE